MRVYEIARDKNVSSRQMLDLLKEAGIELASHMSVVPEEAFAHIDKAFSPKKTEKKSVEKKAEKKTEIKSKPKSEPKPVEKTETKKVISKEEIKPKVVVSPVLNPKPILKPKEDLKTTARPVAHVRADSRFRRYAPESQAKQSVTEIEVSEGKPLFQVAEMMGKSQGDLILALLRKGMACNRNNILSVDVISTLGGLFGINVIAKEKNIIADKDSAAIEKSRNGVTRWPIVVVMGHVDHGKTTLLDFVRKQNTASREKGGITQHLGAYQVSSHHGDIVFLDTPGHEAFSFLRSRGAKITDVAILVVAVDDGIKPQTIEAIKHAKNANVPIIVAANKIDKLESYDAALQTLKRQLAEHDLVVEDWGGDIVCVPISAKTGKGVDELLEMVVLQSEMMDLKADPELPGKAFVLESKIEKGYGPVATVICHEGSIKKGDYFVCGSGTGKVRLLINSLGQKVAQAGPSIPVKIVGFDKFAEIGDWLTIVSAEEYSKAKSGKDARVYTKLPAAIQAMDMVGKEKEKKINLIIKTDARGSREAVEGSLAKLSKKMKKGYPNLNIIYSDVGDISEKDIELSITANALILGLHVKVERNAVSFAKDKSVNIKLFDIIYHLVEFLQGYLEMRKEVKTISKRVALLEVRKVFNIKKIGVVAGCYVKEGVITKGNKVVCVRDKQEIGEGKIKSLQRDTKTVKEVHAGFECGFICEGFNDWQEGDAVVVYSVSKEPVGENN